MKSGDRLAIPVILLFLPALAPANQVQLGFLPSSQMVLVNNSVQVGLGISLLNIGEPPSLGTYDVNVLFDPSLLSFLSVTFGDPILGDQLDLFRRGSITTKTSNPGSINLFELSLDSAADLNAFQAGDFTLFTLMFSGLAPGTSALDVNINALGDAVGAPISALVQSGSITVVDIPVPPPEMPEPTTVALAGLGFAALAVRRLVQRFR